MGERRLGCTERGNIITYPLEEVLGRVLLMPVLAGFRSYARWPCSSPREKLGPVPVTTGVRDTWISSVTLNTPDVTKLSWKSVVSGKSAG